MGAYVMPDLTAEQPLKRSFTISAWVKPTVLNNNNSILEKGDNLSLKLHEAY